MFQRTPLWLLVGILFLAAPARADPDPASAAAFWRQQPPIAAGGPQVRHRPRGHVTRVLPVERRPGPVSVARGRLFDMVSASARLHGVPPAVAHAIVRLESGYNCRARSRSGAMGIMQTMRATARGEGVVGTLTDCATGLEAGMRYLHRILARAGNGCGALSLYQRGIGARPVCTAYGRRALAFVARFGR